MGYMKVYGGIRGYTEVYCLLSRSSSLPPFSLSLLSPFLPFPLSPAIAGSDDSAMYSSDLTYLLTWLPNP